MVLTVKVFYRFWWTNTCIPLRMVSKKLQNQVELNKNNVQNCRLIGTCDIQPFLPTPVMLIFSEAKSQVLANLANFAYDPINYGYIRDVGVLDILIYVVKKETDEKLLQFSVAGICNLCIGKVASLCFTFKFHSH